MTEQEQTQPQTPTPEQEVGEFISRMTEGLEEKPTANTESQAATSDSRNGRPG